LVTCPPDLDKGGMQAREGRSPPLKFLSPSPFKERGIKGVRLLNNLNIKH